MTAVHYNNCEHLHISFERKHNKESKEENICPYLGALHSQNCLRLFVLDSHGTYCMHFQTFKDLIYSEIIQSVTIICLLAIWKINF